MGMYYYALFIALSFAAHVTHISSEDQPVEINAELSFDACLHGLVPRLSAARRLDNNLLRPFRYCHRTWRNSAVAFRQELIEISNRWKELGLVNRSSTQKESETFMTAQLKQKTDVSSGYHT